MIKVWRRREQLFFPPAKRLLIVGFLVSISNVVRKNKKILFRTGTVLLTIFIIVGLTLFLRSKASAATTIGTSTASTAAEYSSERHVWWDGTRYWAGFYDGANFRFVFFYSTNGTSWTENTNARITLTSNNNTAGFSVLGDSSDVFIVYSYSTTGGGGTTKTQQAGSAQGYGAGQANPTTWSWSSSSGINPGCTTFPAHAAPVITRDTNNKIIVGVGCVGDQTEWVYAISSSTNCTSCLGSTSVINNNTASGGSGGPGDIGPLAFGNFYSVFFDGANIFGKKNVSGTLDTTEVPIAKGTNVATNNLSMVSDTSSNQAFLSYIDSNGHTNFRKYEDSSTGLPTKIDDPDNLGSIPVGGRDIVRDSNGNIYVAVNKSGTCEIWESTNNGSSWAEVDPANHPTCTSGAPISIAVDSTNVIHVAYFVPSPSNSINYNTITANSYGTAVSVYTTVGFTAEDGLDIAVDSANSPHILVAETHAPTCPSCTSEVIYANKYGAGSSWSNKQIDSVSGSIAVYKSPSISFENDAPVIAYINLSTTSVIVDRGTASTAAASITFSTKTVDSTVNTLAGTFGCSVIVDSSGNTWLSYIELSPSYVTLAEHKSGDAWTTWQTPFHDPSNITGNEPSLAVAGNMLYILYRDGNTTQIDTEIYNEDTGTWSGLTNLTPSTSFKNAHVRWALNADNQNTALDFLYSDGTDIYYNQAGVWRASVPLDTNSGNSYTSISSEINGKLHVFWERSNVIYESHASSPYTSWSSPSATGGATTPAWLSAAATQSNCTIPILWTDGSGSPYNVDFDNSVTTNCSPAAPTLSLPAASSTNQNIVTSFQLRTTDPDSDYLRYKIVLYASDCSSAPPGFSSVQTFDQTASQTGWTGQDQQTSTAYTGSSSIGSSTMATFTIYATALNTTTTYCWKAAAIDPGGTNIWSSYSSTQTFTTGAYGVQIQGGTQINGGTGVR